MIIIIYILIFFILVFVALIGFKAASSGIKAKQKNKTLKKTINIYICQILQTISLLFVNLITIIVVIKFTLVLSPE